MPTLQPLFQNENQKHEVKKTVIVNWLRQLPSTVIQDGGRWFGLDVSQLLAPPAGGRGRQHRRSRRRDAGQKKKSR